jgi:hypothetical protein
MKTSILRPSSIALALTLGWCLAVASGQQPSPIPKPGQPPAADTPKQNIPAPQPKDATPGDEQGAQQGVHVENRGEVHEGFAQPWQLTVNPTAIIHKQPPDPIAEEPPSQRPAGKNVQWIPGYWQWNDDRKDFNWITGIWRDIPEGRHWVVGHWVPIADGWYRVLGHWAAQAEPDFQYVNKPPEPKEEQQPQSPGDDAAWIPGSWFYTDNGWQWRAGYYTQARDGYVWQPASYNWSPNGYIYTSGYWDYDPMNRGLLFAPVWFDQPYWERPGWFFRPSHALDMAAFWVSLFVRPGWGYYYGDWYGRGYAGLGFRPWYEFGTGRFDPLFSYERFNHRNDAGFFNNIRATNEARIAGRAALPGRTFEANASATAGSRLVVPLNQLHTVNPAIRLENVSAEQRTSIMQNSRTMYEHSLNLGRGNFPANLSTNLRANTGASTSYHYGTFQPGASAVRPEGQHVEGFQNIAPIHPSFGGYHSWGGNGGGGGGGHGGGHR